jgi:hypothetical protein
MKKPIFLFILLSFLTIAVAQNRLYVRVEYNPSMQILGFGGSGFYYDHVLLLPDGTAFRFDDVSEDSEQVLPGGINLATATATDLANAGGTQGTYQDDGATVQTSFGVSFASAGERYSSVMEESGYMYFPPLQPSFITGEYNNFSGTVIGGGFTGTPSVMAGESNNYFFYADGKFGFEESSGVSSDAGNVGVTSSSEGSAAGSYFFEGYNLYITYNDGSEAVLPAYLWPSYQSFVDQILMVGEDEFLNEEESAIPIQLLPATGATNNQPENPLGGNQAQNPLGNGEDAEPQNPLGGDSAANPLAQPSESAVSNDNTLSGTVTFPLDVAISVAFVTVCPMSSLENQDDCSTIPLEASGSYSVELPAAEGDLMVMAAMDADGNNQLNTGDYVAYQLFNPADGLQLDLVLTPYTE